jgi:D-alanine-D-alanine ligase-like ATP-grasp enzyme
MKTADLKNLHLAVLMGGPGSEREVSLRSGAAVARALAEGANVNADSGSPLFLSIMKGNREMVEHLLQAGANPAFFLTKTRLKKHKTPQAILDALMEGAPPPAVDLGPPPGGDDDDDF